ncbi:MAG: hypothetical protein ACRDZN_16435 [Acidimicrobiales bacterium]
MEVGSLADRYNAASEETRRLVNRLLDQDAADQAWAGQLGPVYRQGDVAGLLGKTKQAVSGDRRLLRLELRSGTIGYPAFQFDGRQQTPGLGAIVELLLPVVETSWTIASWLTSPQTDLDDARPLDLLRSGHAVDAYAAARRFAHGLAG